MSQINLSRGQAARLRGELEQLLDIDTCYSYVRIIKIRQLESEGTIEVTAEMLPAEIELEE